MSDVLSDGLSDEQLELLRGIPQGERIGVNDSNAAALIDLEPFVTIRMDECALSGLGNILLATLKAQESRIRSEEREAAEVFFDAEVVDLDETGIGEDGVHGSLTLRGIGVGNWPDRGTRIRIAARPATEKPVSSAKVLEGEFKVKHFDGGDKSDETWDEYTVGGENLPNAVARLAGTHAFNDQLPEGGYECLYNVPVRVNIEPLAAAIEASTQDDWQDISSAPTVGVVLVGHAEYDRPVAAYWSSVERVWKTASEALICDPQPTHWMPLPNPPAAQPDERLGCVCGGTGVAGDHPTGGYTEPCRVCQPVPPSEGEVAAKEPRFFEQGFWIHDREDGPGSMARLVVDHPTQRSLVIDALNSFAANTPPDGHSSVVLSKDDIADLMEQHRNAESPHDRRVFEACRTALEVE